MGKYKKPNMNPLEFFRKGAEKRVEPKQNLEKYQQEQNSKQSGQVPSSEEKSIMFQNSNKVPAHQLGQPTPVSNRAMLNFINQYPEDYKRDRTPNTVKIYTDRGIPLYGPMSSRDSITMAEVEANLWCDADGTKGQKLAKGCGNRRKGGSVKSKKK